MVTFRLLTRDDLALLRDVENDPEAVGEFGWFGYRPNRQPDPDNPVTITDTTGQLAVLSESGEFVGAVAWSQANYGPNGQCPNIGALILPSFRGQGYGTAAQRALAEYLFAHKPVARVEASTEVGNLAEQRALEGAGFTREGVLRHAVFRAGTHRDVVMYSILREEL